MYFDHVTPKSIGKECGITPAGRTNANTDLERARAYRDTEPYRKAMRKRAVWVEPLFGEAKDWHGLRRFRLRRLEKVNTEALLKAAGQNVKRLLAFGMRGPKGPARVVALRQSAPNPYEFRGVRRHRERHSRRPAGVFQHPGAFSEVGLPLSRNSRKAHSPGPTPPRSRGDFSPLVFSVWMACPTGISCRAV